MGPFAKPSFPLARLALEMTKEERSRLRSELLTIAADWKCAIRGPALAVRLFEVTGSSEETAKVHARALLQLGRTREAARIACARAAIDALRPIHALRPEYAEAPLQPILEDPPSLRAKLDALILGARTALMLGDEEAAR